MAKIRTVKPELFRHADLFEAEINSKLPLRLSFIALFGCCDREGRFRWEPRSLKLDILPYDDINFEFILNALWEAGFIKKYSLKNKYFGYIPSWHLHQSINKHEPPSKLPDPQQCVQELTRAVQSTELHMQASALHVQTDAVQETDTVMKILTSSASESESERITPSQKISCIEKPPGISDSSSQQFVPLKNATSNQHDKCCQIEIHESSPDMHMQARAVRMPASLEVEVEMELEVEEELDMEREMEDVKGERGSNRNIVAQTRRQPAISADILSIFDFWKITFQHPQAVLDPKRQRLIRQALQSGYSVAQLCDAISGCFKTPHNMGNNDHGQRYDGLHIILRDSDQIERFIRNHHNPPRPPNPVDKLLQANVDAATNWLNKRNPTGAKL